MGRKQLAGLATCVAVLFGVSPAVAQADPANTTSLAAQPTRVTALRLSEGKLWYADDITAATPAQSRLYVRDADGTTTPATVGPEQAGPTVGPALAVSGSRIAYAEPANTVADIADTRTFAVQRRITLPVGYLGLRLSGQKVSVETATSTSVLHLFSGARWTLPPGAAVSGRYAAWFNADGSVDRKDLLSGATQLIRPAGGPAICTRMSSTGTPLTCAVSNSPTTVKLHNDWLIWKFDCEVRAVRLSGNGAVLASADFTSPKPCLSKFQLLDGGLVYKDPASGALMQLLLDAPASRAQITTGAVSKYAANGHSVAWVTTADPYTVQLGMLPLAYHPRTWLSDEAVPAAFSPNGDGSSDLWRPEFDLTRATNWSLTITNSAGQVVRTIAGNAADVAMPVWDGANDAAAGVPDGAYRWQLSGTAADGDGALVGSDGGTAGLSGSVTVRRVAPVVTVAAPTFSTTVSASTAFGVAWTPVAVPAWPGYTVTGYDVAMSDNGVSRTLASNLAARSLTFAGAQGHTYRFSVRAHDSAGNTGVWSQPAKTTVPIDSSSPALAFSGGWTSLTATGAFLNTERLASAAGSWQQYSGSMTGFDIVTARCPGCGVLRVYLDGRYLAAVDTWASGTQLRRLVYAQSLGTSAAWHTVRLVVAATYGRPRIYLDAFAPIR